MAVMELGQPNPWLVRRRRDPRAALRLLCVPYAGASASVFRNWPDALPAAVEVIAIELPGHGGRSRERPFERLSELIPALGDALEAQLEPPFAVYGHSLGSLIAFALARELRRRRLAQPVHLFVSGRRAPHIPESGQLHTLSDADFTAWLRRLGGVPEAVLQDAELMQFFLPVLRADLAINTSELAHDAPLDCPITAMRGVDDERVTAEQLDAWRTQTQGAFDCESFPGGHFFIQSARAEFLVALARRLSRIIVTQ